MVSTTYTHQSFFFAAVIKIDDDDDGLILIRMIHLILTQFDFGLIFGCFCYKPANSASSAL